MFRCLHVADIELPTEYVGLYELAYNFWWSWHPRARRLFNTIDAHAWSRYHNPVELLINVEPRHWEDLVGNETFMSDYNAVMQEFKSYLRDEKQAWFQQRFGDRGETIAYFSTEYGIHESLPIYSGGLGVLSGDHLKSASDLGLPLVAVGLLYRRGYFNQTVDADGFQQHVYPHLDFTRLPIRPVSIPTGRPVIVSVPFPARDVAAKVWLAQVGRVPLLLLDTDISENDAADRTISSILYVRGREMRLAQELLLGVGGVRALQALAVEPGVWHLNEGHSVLLQIERMRALVGKDEPRALEQLREEVRKTTIFTTHTPVPAGNESFDRGLVCKYIDAYADAMGADCNKILDLASADHGEPNQPFNLTALAIRLSRVTNGVSRLHGDVSSHMWRHLYPADHPEPVIGSITNGVHGQTWIGSEMRDLFTRRLGQEWDRHLFDEQFWQAVHDIPDDDLWESHQTQKGRLGRFTRVSLLSQYARHGGSPDELRALEDWFDPEALTIGFARRYATYKRAELLFRDLVRIRSIVSQTDRPVQIVLAGKAHPADRPAQELVQHAFHLSQSPELRGKVFFLENYSMRLARYLVQGVDVWLNTPIRRQEASGTSGMKAAMNGALNMSIRDGWWPEAYDGENGWAIGDGQENEDPTVRDREDSLSIYSLLEQTIIPLYYQRDEAGLPRDWIQMMKRSMASIIPRFSSHRMVSDYAKRSYFPGAPRADQEGSAD
jgi:starch phosphorylase